MKIVCVWSYKEHHPASAVDKSVSDSREGDTRGADTMDKQDLFAIFGAEFIDTDGTILIKRSNIFSAQLLFHVCFTMFHRISSHRREPLTGVSTSLAPGKASGLYTRPSISSFGRPGIVVLSGFGSALPHRGHSADLANKSRVAVAMAVVVTAMAVCGSGADQRKKPVVESMARGVMQPRLNLTCTEYHRVSML